MNKEILILNLIIKTIVEFIIVIFLVAPIVIVVFIAGYLAYSINNAIEQYKAKISSYKGI